MKIIIFAGGSGRRLWPISRKKSPKQFEPIIGEKSTLRLAVDRVADVYGAENIFISTNEAYVDMIREQLPELPASNVIGEPARRDLAAAVGLALHTWPILRQMRCWMTRPSLFCGATITWIRWMYFGACWTGPRS